MVSDLQKEKESQGVFEQVILGIAHELNNPNTFIRMNILNIKKMFTLLAPCLASCAEKNPDAKYGPYTLTQLQSKINKHLDSTLEASVRLIDIAEKLKQCTTTSLEDSAKFSMKEIIEDLMVSHQFFLDNYSDVRFLVDSESTYEVLGYKLQLEQAISSLVVNACHAISERYKKKSKDIGTLIISLSKISGLITISIEDNGTGMDKNVYEKAFIPYFTTKPHGMGDGLGLAICRSVVMRHGGSVAIETEVKKGTKIIVEIPEVPDV